jgi:serine/threonine-protein kinase
MRYAVSFRAGFGLVIFATMMLSGFAQTEVLYTIAGPKWPADGSRATTQSIGARGVAADNAGGFYFSSANHAIYRVTADGILHQIAGVGVQGFSGDGGRAAKARLNTPLG